MFFFFVFVCGILSIMSIFENVFLGFLVHFQGIEAYGHLKRCHMELHK